MPKSNCEVRRGAGGRFAAGHCGGPGRPKGAENTSTIDARQLRRRILDCWNRIDGDKLLDEYARDNFGEFLRIVVRLLPAGIEVDLPKAEVAQPIGHSVSNPMLDRLERRWGRHADPDPSASRLPARNGQAGAERPRPAAEPATAT